VLGVFSQKVIWQPIMPRFEWKHCGKRGRWRL